MVTVTYEKARGLRQKHERPDGYQIGTSKTIGVPVASLFEAWANEEQRRRWLADDQLSVSKATPSKSLRAKWGKDGGRVDVNFYAKGDSRSQLSLTHGRIPGPETAAELKEFWSERLLELKNLLEG